MSRPLPRLLAAAIVLAFAGCASWPPWAASRLLDQADTLATAGELIRALPLYEEFLTKFPEHTAVPRARMTRDTIAALQSAREDLSRLQSELARRQDREVELARIRAELDRLRADLERLKRLDMQLERRRPAPR